MQIFHYNYFATSFYNSTHLKGIDMKKLGMLALLVASQASAMENTKEAKFEIVGKYGGDTLARGVLGDTWQDLKEVMHGKPENFITLFSRTRVEDPSYCTAWGGIEEKLVAKYLKNPSASLLCILQQYTKVTSYDGRSRLLAMEYPEELLDSKADPYRHMVVTTPVIDLPGYMDPAGTMIGNLMRTSYGRRDKIVGVNQYKEIVNAYQTLLSEENEEVNIVFNKVLKKEFGTDKYYRKEVDQDDGLKKFEKLPHMLNREHAAKLTMLKLTEKYTKNDEKQVVMSDLVLNVFAHYFPDTITTLCNTKDEE